MAKFLVCRRARRVFPVYEMRTRPLFYPGRQEADLSPSSPARNESPERGGDGNLFGGARSGASAGWRILLHDDGMIEFIRSRDVSY